MTQSWRPAEHRLLLDPHPARRPRPWQTLSRGRRPWPENPQPQPPNNQRKRMPQDHPPPKRATASQSRQQPSGHRGGAGEAREKSYGRVVGAATLPQQDLAGRQGLRQEAERGPPISTGMGGDPRARQGQCIALARRRQLRRAHMALSPHLETVPASQVPSSSKSSREDQVILLSFFDGAGVAALALQDHVKISHAFIWEIDPMAVEVCMRNFKGVMTNRGDITMETAEDLARTITQLDRDRRQSTAPTSSECSVISWIASRLSCSGASSASWWRTSSWPAMGTFGLVSRPRLWWARIPWDRCCDFKWSKQGRLHRLQASPTLACKASVSRPRLSRARATASRRQPPPMRAGKPPKKSIRSKIDGATRQRWIEASCCFAPWHYEDFAMVRDPDKALVTVPIHLKKQAHGLPVGFTSGPSCSWPDRHRLLGNCWHRGLGFARS